MHESNISMWCKKIFLITPEQIPSLLFPKECCYAAFNGEVCTYLPINLPTAWINPFLQVSLQPWQWGHQCVDTYLQLMLQPTKRGEEKKKKRASPLYFYIIFGRRSQTLSFKQQRALSILIIHITVHCPYTTQLLNWGKGQRYVHV